MKKIGIIAFSCFLTFALARFISAQQPNYSQPQQNPGATQKNPAAPGQTATTEKQTATKQEIRQAQQALKDKGMWTGAVNGMTSPEWEQALRDFQMKNSLKVNGKLDN